MKDNRLLAILLVGFVAFGVYAWLMATMVFQTQADVSTVSITADPFSDASEYDFGIAVTPDDSDNKISGLDLVVDVENGEIEDWGKCTTVAIDDFTELISEPGATARYSCVIIKDTEQLPALVTLAGNVTCTGDQPAVVRVNQQRTEVSGPVEGSVYELNKVEEFTVNCGGTGGGDHDKDVSVDFSPASCSADVGGSCEYDVTLAARESKKISGYYYNFAFDPEVVTLSDITFDAQSGTPNNPSPTPEPSATPAPSLSPDPSVTPGPTGTVTPGPTATVTTAPTTTQNRPTIIVSPTASPDDTNVPPTATPTPSANTNPIVGDEPDCTIQETDIDNEAGSAKVLVACKGPETDLPTSFTDTLSFDAVGTGSGTVTLQGVQVVGPDGSSAYTVNRGKATYVIGGSSTEGNIELDMKLRLQCVVRKPVRDVPVRVNVGLGDGTLDNTIYKDVEMTFDDDGHLVGKVSFDAVPGDGFKIMPKYEYGMRKKICENGVKEDFPGGYRCDKGDITLTEGTNEIDFTGIILMSGDIPPDGQDGVSNSFDFALVRNLIGKNTEEALIQGDVNFDGANNQVDHACMLAFERWDEQ